MINYEIAIHNIRQSLKHYIISHKLQSLVIGMSGGIDSTLCAALAEPVCKNLNIALIGRSIPITTNKPDEIERAYKSGGIFCTEFQETDLSDAFVKLIPVLNPHYKNPVEDKASKIRLGNIKARMRMMLLYDLASTHKGLVISTDNYTEYLLGFWTLHGDHADYGLIQYLWKTEVYSLSRTLIAQYRKSNNHNAAEVLQLCVDATPTDGLGISSSDYEQFGATSYDEVDETLQIWLALKTSTSPDQKLITQLATHPVVVKHESTHFKREWPFSISREIIELQTLLP